MTFIILVKDVVTFGSFKSIDFDGHENDKKSVGLGPGGYSLTLPMLVCAAQRGHDFEAPDFERGFRGVF